MADKSGWSPVASPKGPLRDGFLPSEVPLRSRGGSSNWDESGAIGAPLRVLRAPHRETAEFRGLKTA